MAETNQSPINGKLAFIGAGRMATALAKGFVSSGLIEPQNLVASDPSAEAREAFNKEVPDASTTDDSHAALKDARVVVLAVKPQVMSSVLKACGKAIPADAVLVSIAAGIPIAKLAAPLPETARIVRVMPNTPCLIGRGVSGYSLGPRATEANGELVARLMGAVGYVVQVSEPMLDVVAGVSGSGPAFVYTVIEALADAGVRAGLPRAVAQELAARMTAGASEMVTATGEHPALLREAVTSPGGTTAAGLAALEEHGLSWALHAAVAATIERTKELADS